MELTTFIQSLLSEGKVSVKGELLSFTEDDKQQTASLLQQYYHEDLLEMPFTAPAFLKDAALWAAQYFYQAVQLTVLRDADEKTIEKHLLPFASDITPEAIYSADLIFRYLPSLFNLAKGLAPADMLVQELRRTAALWPFSSVGIELEETLQQEIIFLHPSLKQEYIDRIIKNKDKKRITHASIKTSISEATGEYASAVWPGLETILQTNV